jgi:hypothetical protein
MHPEWASCTPSMKGGLYDPPRTLHPGLVLVPTTVNAMTTILASAVPRPSSTLPTRTQSIHETTTPRAAEVGAGSTASPRQSLSPLVTMPIPRPVFVQPAQDPFIFEPGKPPRLNTLVMPHLTPTAAGANLQESASTLVRLDDLQQTVTMPLPDLALFTFNNEAFTANPGGYFVISSQTLAPGAAITLGATILSLDAKVSYIVINATTIPLERITQTQSPQNAAFQNKVTFVYGGSTNTQPNGHLDVTGGSTTVVPAHPKSHEKDPYTLVIGGSTTTLINAQKTSIRSLVTGIIAQHTILVSLTVADTTITLPNGAVAVYKSTKTVISADVTPGAKTLTLTYGGRTVTRGDGWVTVVDGTVTVLPAPAGGRMTTGEDESGDVVSDGKSLSTMRGPTAQGARESEETDGGEKGTSKENSSVKMRVVRVDLFLSIVLLVLIHQVMG